MHEHLILGEPTATTVVLPRYQDPAQTSTVQNMRYRDTVLAKGTSIALERKLGQGGFGDIWEATLHDGNSCIAKVARTFPEDTQRERTVARMMRHEAEMLRRCAGIDGVPMLLGETQIDGQPALLLEHLIGCTWRTVLRKPCGNPRQFLKHAVSLAHTLACIHARGIVHGDVKPDNILLGRRHEPKDEQLRSYLIDFGMAHDIHAPAEVTQGTLGTRGYLDPRMIGNAHRRNAASDVYSFGIMAYEGYTGSPFFTKADWNEALLLRRGCDDGTVESHVYSEWYADLLADRTSRYGLVSGRLPDIECLITDILRHPTTQSPRPSSTDTVLRLLECLADM